MLGGDRRGQPGPLVVAKPGRVRRPVREVDPGYDAQRHRRQALDQEQPLPAGQAEPAVQVEQSAGDHAHEHIAQGIGALPRKPLTACDSGIAIAKRAVARARCAWGNHCER